MIKYYKDKDKASKIADTLSRGFARQGRELSAWVSTHLNREVEVYCVAVDSLKTDTTTYLQTDGSLKE